MPPEEFQVFRHSVIVRASSILVGIFTLVIEHVKHGSLIAHVVIDVHLQIVDAVVFNIIERGNGYRGAEGHSISGLIFFKIPGHVEIALRLTVLYHVELLATVIEGVSGSGKVMAGAEVKARVIKADLHSICNGFLVERIVVSPLKGKAPVGRAPIVLSTGDRSIASFNGMPRLKGSLLVVSDIEESAPSPDTGVVHLAGVARSHILLFLDNVVNGDNFR